MLQVLHITAHLRVVLQCRTAHDKRYGQIQKNLCESKLRFAHGGFSYTPDGILPHIFRLRFRGGFGRAKQGGRGVPIRKQGENFFPLTLFACISAVCIFESLKISRFSKNAVLNARNFLHRVENFWDFGGVYVFSWFCRKS